MTNQGPRLVILDGKLAGRSVPLEGAVIIGRQEGVKIRLPDVKVSREHTKVFRQGDEWIVADLNSRNGTLVNDAPVTRRALHDGDELKIGETRMRFEAPVDAPEIELPRATERKAEVKEVIDLRQRPPTQPAAPAGALRADQIEVKQRALQFSKVEGKKSRNPLFDDLGQRPLLYQLLMILVVLVVGIGFIYLGLALAGIVG